MLNRLGQGAVWLRQGDAQGYQAGTVLPFMGKDVFHEQGQNCIWWPFLVPAALDSFIDLNVYTVQGIY